MNDQWILDNIWWLVLIAAWEFVWKGIALWRSARQNDKAWFVVLLLLNTLGLLPIAYLLVFSKRPTSSEASDEQ